MKELTLKQAAEDCHGTLAPEQAEGIITGVQIDSRRVKPGDLFIAIKGERADGHNFIDMAASLGAAAALVERPVKASIPTILVPDTVKAYGDLSCDLYIPFWNLDLEIPTAVYMVFAAFVIVGCVNAVNLTDGVDGLSSSVTIPVMVFFATTSYIYGRTTLALLPATVAGGLAGFLCYNFHPAKVFMGDTGSLFLGGMVCGMAFALDMPLILILVGIIYLCETLSVILQVTYFKLTHGKRIFKMTPIHHHFELCGWKEEKIVFVFTAITLVMCVLAYLGVMNRY